MNLLLRFFLRLMLLREGPQGMPSSWWLLKGLLVLSVALSLPLVVQVYGQLGPALLGIGVELTASGLLLWVVLKLREHPERWQQSYSAWLGVGVLFSLFSYLLQTLLSLGAPGSLIGTLELMLFFWSIVVLAHVLRHAAEIPFPFAFFIMLFYTFSVLGLIAEWLLPPEALQAAEPSALQSLESRQTPASPLN